MKRVIPGVIAEAFELEIRVFTLEISNSRRRDERPVNSEIDFLDIFFTRVRWEIREEYLKDREVAANFKLRVGKEDVLGVFEKALDELHSINVKLLEEIG